MRLLRTTAVGVLILLMWVGVKASYSATSAWPNSCGDGQIDFFIDDFETPSPWSVVQTRESHPLTQAEGCRGVAGDHSLAITYDLTGGDWLVILRNFSPPRNTLNVCLSLLQSI